MTLHDLVHVVVSEHSVDILRLFQELSAKNCLADPLCFVHAVVIIALTSYFDFDETINPLSEACSSTPYRAFRQNA